MGWGAATSASMPEPKLFDKGLIFVKDTDILLSGDKLTIAVNIPLDDYSTIVYLMKSMLGDICQKIQVHKNSRITAYSFDINWEELDLLTKMVEEFEDDSRKFQKLLFEETLVRNPRSVNVRTKRGLLDILGYGLKYLFGPAVAIEIKRLAQVCNEIHTFKLRWCK